MSTEKETPQNETLVASVEPSLPIDRPKFASDAEKHAEAMRIAGRMMDEYAETLRALAKS